MALFLGSNRVDASSPSGAVEYVTPVSGVTYSSTTTNAWEATNISFTVPEGHIYIVQVTSTYTNGKPYGLGLHSSTTLNQSAPLMSCQETVAKYLTRATFFVASGTWYICILRAGTGSNTYNIYGLDFTI